MPRNTRWAAIVTLPAGGQRRVGFMYSKPDATEEEVRHHTTFIAPLPLFRGQTDENVKFYGPFASTAEEVAATTAALKTSSLNAKVKTPKARKLEGVPDIDPNAQPVADATKGDTAAE
ncbi:MAG TPA: hypothetical protein VGN72_01090 [Tepidisphaeraceae bacterium]|jgi:hypothetical protein|nr:hypothetical protein [Tepidisphaeraceae bacterium]